MDSFLSLLIPEVKLEEMVGEEVTSVTIKEEPKDYDEDEIVETTTSSEGMMNSSEAGFSNWLSNCGIFNNSTLITSIKAEPVDGDDHPLAGTSFFNNMVPAVCQQEQRIRKWPKKRESCEARAKRLERQRLYQRRLVEKRRQIQLPEEWVQWLAARRDLAKLCPINDNTVDSPSNTTTTNNNYAVQLNFESAEARERRRERQRLYQKQLEEKRRQIQLPAEIEQWLSSQNKHNNNKNKVYKSD